MSGPYLSKVEGIQRRRRRGPSLNPNEQGMKTRIMLALVQIQNDCSSVDPRLASRLEICQNALDKYPLPIAKGASFLEHVSILEGFNKDVMQRIRSYLPPPRSASPITKAQKTDDNHDNQDMANAEEKCPMNSLQDNNEKDFHLSQEETDCALARSLSLELNGCQQDEMPSTQTQKDIDNDWLLAQKLHSQNYAKPSSEVPARTKGKRRQIANAFRLSDDESEDKSCMSQEGQDPLGKGKKVASSNSKRSKVTSAMDALFAHDPVFNSEPTAGRGKGRGQARTRGSSTAGCRSKAGINGHTEADTISTRVVEVHKASSSENDEPCTDRPVPCVAMNNVHTMSDSDSDVESIHIPETKAAKRKAGRVKKKPEEFFVSEKDLPHWVLQTKEDATLSDSNKKPRHSESTAHGPQIVLNPGSFDVVLLVDNAEIIGAKAGGKKTKREVTIKELRANGVHFECRHLSLGDFMWVARERSVPLDPNSLRQRQPHELVLPHIVERKRMDDLRSSIIDGRYKEQKARMKTCGLRQKWYLVEEYTKHMKHWAGSSKDGGKGFSMKALDSAIATTASMQGFTLKMTENQADSVAFLTLLTRTLQERYSKMKLTSCTRDNYERGLVVSESETVLFTFKEFNEDSRKTKPLTLSEAFCRMLISQFGVTWAMATAITKKYPTPAVLMRHLESNCTSAEEKEALLAGLVYDGRKKIRPEIAKVISWLYSKNDLD